MNKLEEIINQGRSLLFDIYEIRNEVVKTHAFQSPTSQHDAGTLINAHDQMLSALDELESLSGIALEEEYEVPDFGDSDYEEDASVTPQEVLLGVMVRGGWSSTSLAEQAGVSRMTITNFLKGESNSRRSTLAKIEQAAGLGEGVLGG